MLETSARLLRLQLATVPCPVTRRPSVLTRSR